MLKLISSLFSYLKKEKKIQGISEFIFQYLNKKKRIQILLGVLLLIFIIILFSIQGTSDSNQVVKEKQLKKTVEENDYKSNNFSKNSEVIIEKKQNKKAAKDELSKPNKPKEEKIKKVPIKNKLETQTKNKAETIIKKNNKNIIKNFDNPKKVVNDLHIGLKKVSEKNPDSPSDLINLIEKTYNTEKMIEKIIGDTWKKTNKKDQEEIVIIFQEYIAKNYLKRFKKIKNPNFNFKESKKIGKKFMLVKTDLVVDKEEEVSINYLLLFENNRWRIFDVLLAGSISEIATKKSEFSGFISDGKITPLINALKKQNSMLNN